jgi:hypothetical protein
LKLINDNSTITLSKIGIQKIYAIYLKYIGSFEATIKQESISVARMNKNTIILISFTPISDGDLIEYNGSLGIISGYGVNVDLEKIKIRFEKNTTIWSNISGDMSTTTQTWGSMENKVTENIIPIGKNKITYMENGNLVTINDKSRGGSRKYESGEVYHPSLPKSYKLGVTKSVCNNCSYNINRECSKWENAIIKNNYWCKSWKGMK